MTDDEYRRACRAVRSLVGRYRRCWFLADDLEQAGHLGYHRALADPRWDPDSCSAETWAFGGARHAIHVCFHAERRHRGRIARLRAIRPTREASGLDPIDRLAVREAVAALPEAERDLIVAWFWEGLTPTEHARDRGIGEWVAYRIRDRALASLAVAIGDHP